MDKDQRDEILANLNEEDGIAFSVRHAVDLDFREFCVATHQVYCISNFLIWLMSPKNAHGKLLISMLSSEVNRREASQ